MNAPCTREFRHGPHRYPVVGVAEYAQCPGRERRARTSVGVLVDTVKYRVGYWRGQRAGRKYAQLIERS
jgi:hypothetical protein